MLLKHSKKELILLVLLVVLTIIIRIPTMFYSGDPDSYTYQGLATNIIENGYAIWVWHPASLFGMYPSSYTSAYMYYLSYFSLITGLSMEQSIFIISIMLGVIGTLSIYIFAKEFGNFLFAYISALVFSLSVYFVNYSTGNHASTRILFVSLLPLFLWVLLRVYESKGHRVKYVILSVILYVFIAMAHRLVQLVSVVLIAYFLTILYFLMPKIWPRFKKTKFYKIYFKRRYVVSKKNMLMDITLALFIIGVYMFIRHKIVVLAVYLLIFLYFILPEYKKYSQPLLKKAKSNMRIIFDVCLLALALVISKFLDLLIRGRLGISIERQIEEYTIYSWSLTGLIKIVEIITILTAILLLTLGLSIFIYSLSKKLEFKKINYLMNNLQKKTITIIKTRTHLCISILLLIIFLVLFISQFFGHSLYSLRIEDYYESKLFEGTSPLAIFLNMAVNYTTGITILFPLVGLGIIILIFKKNKNFSEIFLMLIMLGLISLLLDKRYTRIFVISFFSLFIGIALAEIIKRTNRLRFRKTVFTSFILLFIILISFSAVFTNRDYFFEKERRQEQESRSKQGYTAAMFMKNLDLDNAIIGDTGLSIVYGLSETKLVPLSYIYRLDLKAKRMSFKEIIDSIFNGRQIKSIWTLEDWINGGEYYTGKHSWQIINTPYTSTLNQRLLEDYQVQFFVRDKKKSKGILFTSIEPIKNKMYDNPSISIWDINEDKGRA